ncbi:DNA modification methylase [Enterococcus faecalis]|uniref:site-specific DNA-methyltransferase n=2 Tax=Enterococcus faecalis TaxID=1351 RepID=UPI0013306481|nr:site-specific DNA-methyltransferase [Enterococcus faecalis]EGO5122301.1 DNA modification methylase [Enterococcus faecalis]MCO5407369.1 site-specific DNA-methyltransferase [Enterococcus faecalis]MCO5474827.1 site-specific DNA-methyltransferase [Enterococcus faecalis]MDT2116344.1 site-specific DNA-methyltransferase [Enterococcus faecalis]
MKFEKMKLSELHPAEYNPRVELKPGMEEYEKLKQSILEFGFVDPPIFNKRTGNLVGGHQRVSVAKDLGIGEIEVSIVDLPIEKEKALNIALNKISGQWDEDKLALLLNELDENELNISGFTDKEIQEVIDQYDMRLDLETEAIDDGFEFELPEKPKAALGDIYQLGRHRLMCGDSTNKAHIELLMDGEKADLLITDPPYNVNYEGKTEAALKIKNDNKTASEFYDFLRSAFSSAYDNLKEGASFYVWYASSEVINFVNSLVDSQFMVKQELIWLKNSFVLGRQDYHWQHEPCLYGWKKDGSHRWYGDRKQTTILDFDKPIANKEHPTMKPIPLFDYQIKNSSKKGDKILDIFGGSGTTMIACEQNDRQAYLMELDPKYVDVIINRWEEFTGKEAIKLN